MGQGRHLGAGADPVTGPGARRGRRGVDRVGGLHHRPGASACGRGAPHPSGGHDRTTRCRGPGPGDHALGHSRGGWTTKAHPAVHAADRPRAIRLTPGQAGDNRELTAVLAQIAAPTGARPRSRPTTANADRAYSHPSTRQALRRGGSSRSPRHEATRSPTGRPVDPAVGDHRRSTARPTGHATPSSGPSAGSRSGAAWPPATTDTPATTAPDSYSPPSSGSGRHQPSHQP